MRRGGISNDRQAGSSGPLRDRASKIPIRRRVLRDDRHKDTDCPCLMHTPLAVLPKLLLELLDLAASILELLTQLRDALVVVVSGGLGHRR